MHVIVCGSRTWTATGHVNLELDRLQDLYGVDSVIEGDAPGADRAGRGWAKRAGVPVTTVPAEWTRLGNRAGFVRNQRMLDLLRERPGEIGVIAFRGHGASPGTDMMIRLAREAGVPVRIVRAHSTALAVVGQ